MSKPIEEPDFSRVVMVTPARSGHGGIAAVTAAYGRNFADLRFAETNSPRGSFAGAFALAGALARLLLYRLGGRSIMHVHSAAGKSFARKRIAMAWGRLLGYKIVFHSHSGLFSDTVQQLGAAKVRSVLAKCSRIAVLSRSWKEYFEGELGCADVSVIPNIVEDRGPYRPHRTGSPLRFIFMGLLVERKGIFDLLEAVRPLAREFAGRFELIVCGAHGEEARFRSLIADDPLRQVVKYRGWLSGNNKEAELDAADVVVLPSYAEGIPISILEGYVRGLPAIATAVGGVPDMLTDGVEGRLVQPGDVAALTQALRDYIEQPRLVETHGAAARTRVEQHLPHSVAAALSVLYSKI